MELLFDVFLIVLFSVFLFLSNDISDVTIGKDNLGSAGFPRLIAIVAILLLALVITQKIRVIVKARKMTADGEQQIEKGSKISNSLYKRLFSMIILLVFYILFLKQLGFVLETAVFIFLSLTILGERKYLRSIIFSVVFTAMLVIIFGKIFFIALPRGTGFLRELSYFIF